MCIRDRLSGVSTHGLGATLVDIPLEYYFGTSIVRMILQLYCYVDKSDEGRSLKWNQIQINTVKTPTKYVTHMIWWWWTKKRIRRRKRRIRRRMSRRRRIAAVSYTHLAQLWLAPQISPALVGSMKIFYFKNDFKYKS